MTDGEIRIIVGASAQEYPGWIRTQQHELDLTKRADWERQFPPGGIDRILAEHVWEHLEPAQAMGAATICFEFLRAGGFLRCAVPDGLFPDSAYQRMVQVGGPGPLDHPAASHRVVYDFRSLGDLFRRAGFAVRLLEWWDEHGRFHAEDWIVEDGFVYRSKRFDHRNQNGQLGFTSLIVDAVKPG